jgi:hypothetical protein
MTVSPYVPAGYTCGSVSSSGAVRSVYVVGDDEIGWK